MQSTTHKYHSWQPDHERSNLDIYYPVRNELNIIDDNTNQPILDKNSDLITKTIVDNEQYKTTNSTTYQGDQKNPSFNEHVILKKSPFHGYVNYVNDAELAKIKFPSTGVDPLKVYTSSSNRVYTDPSTASLNNGNIPNPKFTDISRDAKKSNIINLEGTESLHLPFASASVMKQDFKIPKEKQNGQNQFYYVHSEQAITRSNMPPIPITIGCDEKAGYGVSKIHPQSHKMYNLAGKSLESQEQSNYRFTTSSGKTYKWPIQKVIQPEDKLLNDRAVELNFGTNQWGEPNRWQTSYQVHGQSNLAGNCMIKKMPSVLN